MPIDQRRVRLLALTLLLIFVTALFVGGHQPESGSLFPPPWDKVVHILFYGAIVILLCLAFPNLHWVPVLLIALSIGMADEFHQSFVPERQASFDDLAADVIGIALALVLLPRLRHAFTAGPGK